MTYDDPALLVPTSYIKHAFEANVSNWYAAWFEAQMRLKGWATIIWVSKHSADGSKIWVCLTWNENIIFRQDQKFPSLQGNLKNLQQGEFFIKSGVDS